MKKGYISLSGKTRHKIYMKELMRKQNPDVHFQYVNLEIPSDDLVDQDIHETSLYRFVVKKN